MAAGDRLGIEAWDRLGMGIDWGRGRDWGRKIDWGLGQGVDYGMWAGDKLGMGACRRGIHWG